MNIRYSSFFFSLLLILFFAVPSQALRHGIPDVPQNYVSDLAGIIDNNIEDQLNGYLQELEQKTTAQVFILTINSLEGESIDELSLNIAHDKWKIGQAGKDNGALILVSVEDRKYRFEIGYGLEGILPDSLVGSIGREYLMPYFRKGDYSNGIFAATLAMINHIAVNADVEITGMPKLRRQAYGDKGSKDGGLSRKIFSILFVIGAIILFITNPRLFILLLLFSSGGRGSGWGGGGGFGGGGGGGFGGGGASGGW